MVGRRENLKKKEVTAVAQSVCAFASNAKVCAFEFQPRQTKVNKAGSNSSTAKLSATGVSVMDLQGLQF